MIASVSLVVGVTLGKLTQAALRRLTSRSSSQFDDELVARLAGPLMLGWTLTVALAVLPWAGLVAEAGTTTHKVLRAGFFAVVFWAGFRAIDVLIGGLAGSAWVRDRPASRAFLPLGGRVGKVVLLVLAIVALLSTFGFPVASLIAGLGIGGLAVALGAQKTLENVFGAFAIGVDQPLREGDTVKVDDFIGTVERIGLRSTRFRTPDRTIITLPNGKLADMKVETFAARDRIRLALELPLSLGTPPARAREVLAKLRAELLAHPKICPDPVVALKEISARGLVIDIVAWFGTTDWAEFLVIRQDMLLRFLDLVEGSGERLALPAQTIELRSGRRARES